MITITEYKKAFNEYFRTNNDTVLCPISDAIDQMAYSERIELRKLITAANLPVMHNLTYDYKNDQWILNSDGTLS